MAIAPESTATEWYGEAALSGKTGANFTLSVIFPDQERQKRLMQRLIVRSTLEGGFDRRTLLNIDSEAWGIADN